MTDFIEKYDAPREIIPLADEFEANWAEFNELSDQKPLAWVVALAGGGLFMGGTIFGNPEIGYPLGGFGSLVGVVGGVWLYNIREKLNRNAEKGLRVTKALESKGWGCVPISSQTAKLYRLES